MLGGMMWMARRCTDASLASYQIFHYASTNRYVAQQTKISCDLHKPNHGSTIIGSYGWVKDERKYDMELLGTI